MKPNRFDRVCSFGRLDVMLASHMGMGLDDRSCELKIPFNRPYVTGREFQYMREALEIGHASGDGSFTRKCHELLEHLAGAPKALLTTSCTHALEMAALLLNIVPGDEVIIPAFTFVSTVNAFVLRGAVPVFLDSRPDTLNLDESLLENLITDRTRAIVAVHYAGVGCEMDQVLKIAAAHGIAVVEDNAHGFLGKYRDKHLGTFGCMAAQSFHETKNVTCGEGGALLINDPQYVDRAEIIREKGTDRSRFFRCQVDKYTWVDVGSSYLPSDLLAAFLLAQLESVEEIQAKRRRIWHTYHAGLGEWADKLHVRLPFIPEYCEQPYHMFYLITPSLEFRQALIARLRDRGILSVFHYLPLNRSDAGRRFGRPTLCPVAEDISERLVRLPFYTGLDEADQRAVIDAVRSFAGSDIRVYAS
jgi:dTDP-4-amino-4,6-dideoxygalactose transaminase